MSRSVQIGGIIHLLGRGLGMAACDPTDDGSGSDLRTQPKGGEFVADRADGVPGCDRLKLYRSGWSAPKRLKAAA